MSDDTRPRVSTGLAGAPQEIRGVFDRQDRFDEALDRLRQLGFDRADLSVPDPAPTVGAATAEGAAANPDTPIDRQQARTIAGSTTGITAAMIGAGVTVATGGAAAVAAGVAIAAGLAAGGAAHAVTAAGMGAAHEDREQAAATGRLTLAVVTRDAEHERLAVDTLRACGAAIVGSVVPTAATGTAPPRGV